MYIEKPYKEINLENKSSLAQQLVKLEVISNSYDSDAPELGINDYFLVKYEEANLVIQVEFAQPYKLSRSVKEPEILILRFREIILSTHGRILETTDTGTAIMENITP